MPAFTTPPTEAHPVGTPYTTYSHDLGSHGMCWYAVPDSIVGATPNVKAVLYCHGSGGAANQFLTLSSWVQMKNWFMDNGVILVEGDGGPAGGSNWGNQESRVAYLACLAYVETLYTHVTKRGLIGRSMGALPASWLASSLCPVSFDCWVNNSGVSTMLNEGIDTGLPNTDPTYKNWMSTAQYFGSAIYSAYGQTSYANLKSYLLSSPGQDYVPESWDASVWADTKILRCYGTADNTVPWDTRGAKLLGEIWEGEPTIDLTSPKVGGDHSGTNGSYTDLAAMVPFFIDGLDLAPPPVVIPTYKKIHSRRLLGTTGTGTRLYNISRPPMEVPPD